ncbi:hypothetical protein [Paenibacillus sp. V4I7]|uniref:hypothetical protein n=1 Tax=Paenibacillus sp. V4I7 TaxID=3042307 RepID=UPI00278463E5|nr:hypothetical protein [Paenibacillus sp. V4I7]MDQ0898457.1 hypothetical protein [Paenibacillus sp. V4I7]
MNRLYILRKVVNPFGRRLNSRADRSQHTSFIRFTYTGKVRRSESLSAPRCLSSSLVCQFGIKGTAVGIQYER